MYKGRKRDEGKEMGGDRCGARQEGRGVNRERLIGRIARARGYGLELLGRGSIPIAPPR